MPDPTTSIYLPGHIDIADVDGPHDPFCADPQCGHRASDHETEEDNAYCLGNLPVETPTGQREKRRQPCKCKAFRHR